MNRTIAEVITKLVLADRTHLAEKIRLREAKQYVLNRARKMWNLRLPPRRSLYVEEEVDFLVGECEEQGIPCDKKDLTRIFNKALDEASNTFKESVMDQLERYFR